MVKGCRVEGCGSPIRPGGARGLCARHWKQDQRARKQKKRPHLTAELLRQPLKAPVPVRFAMEAALKERIDRLARDEGIKPAEWIRRACVERAQRIDRARRPRTKK